MRRPAVLAVALVGAGSALALLGFSLTWVTVTATTPGLPTTIRAVSGRDVEPGATALVVLLVAALLAVWATYGVVRRVVGVVIALAGLALAVVAVRAGLAPYDAARVPESTELGGVPAFVPTSWWWLAAAGGLLAAGGGVVVAVTGHRWSAMSERYGADRAPVPAPTRAGSRDAWQLLDQGVDPTADPAADPAAGPAAED